MAVPSGSRQLKDVIYSYHSRAPSAEDVEKGHEVLNIVSETLLGPDYRETASPAFPALKLRYSTNQSVTLGIIPLDFYAWKLWRPYDPIALCVAGTPSESTFHSLVRKRLREASDLITIERGDKSEATFNLQISTIKVLIRYHPNPLISRWTGIKRADVDEIKANLPWQSQARFAELERTQEVANQLLLYGVDIATRSYFMYEAWAKNLGFYPWTLTREHILAMAIYALYTCSSSHELATLDLPVPEERDETEETSRDLGFAGVKLKKAPWETLRGFVDRARKALNRNAELSLLDFSVTQWPLFFNLWNSFVRVDVGYWGPSGVARSKYFQVAENAIRFGLLKEAKKFLPGSPFHLWPCPFQEQGHSPWMDEGLHKVSIAERQSHLLKAAVEHKMYIESEAEARGSQPIQLTYFIGFDDFGKSPQGDLLTDELVSKWFSDALDWEMNNHSFFRVSTVSSSRLSPTNVPYIPYPIAIPEDIRKLDQDDDEEYELPEAPASSSAAAKSKKSKSKSKSKTKGKTEEEDMVPETTQPSIFLRPAADVLHRIRHDSSFKTDDFLIGYLDRHTGMKEIPFDWWTVENTAEEFIPQSRIRYFKRKSDAVKVWDRESRTDLVLGTGKHEA